MKSLFIAALMLLISGIAHAESTPRSTLEQFYSIELNHPTAGLLSDKELEAVRGLLSPELSKLIIDAKKAEAICISKAPAGDKPDVFEGNLFSGIYEGGSEIVYDSMTKGDQRMVAAVKLLYIDPRFPKGHLHRTASSDLQVVLREDKGRWVIDDFVFAAKKDRMLSDILKRYIDHCKPTAVLKSLPGAAK